ncbi:class I SAM-dependent methyltransferase [Candidatus Parcubacteria bacterium]|nr:class I SAM-dependent methyltransferase [Candidatus Parcubacteria bacterium]
MIKKKYKIIKDPRYGYLRVDPLPTEKEVEKYYREDFHSNPFQCDDSSLSIQQQQKEFYDSCWEAVCRQALKYFGRTKDLSVFDIGCGFGNALQYFKKKGMKVSGIESTEERSSYAQSKGLKVHHCAIEDFGCISEERFDLVTLFIVLEHLREPAKILTNIKNQLLKPDGLLVIDVPNEFNDFQLVADKEYKLNQWWVCPPNHINYFSASSLENLLKKVGYKIIHKESSFPMELFLLMGDTYVGNQKLGEKCHKKRILFEHLMRKYKKHEKLIKFYQALAELDLGRQITIYAQPK